MIVTDRRYLSPEENSPQHIYFLSRFSLALPFSIRRVAREKIVSEVEAICSRVSKRSFEPNTSLYADIEEINEFEASGLHRAGASVWQDFCKTRSIARRALPVAALFVGAGVAGMWPEYQAAVAQGQHYVWIASNSTPLGWGANLACLTLLYGFSKSFIAACQLIKKSVPMPRYHVHRVNSHTHDFSI